ncbi:MAG: YtxH domain-containing protein [Candidatus Glassbacteria bacterium]
MSEHEYGAFSLVKAFLLGAIAGAGAALLFAPTSGRETRKRIADKTDETKKAIKDTTEQVIKKSNELMEEGKKRVDTLKGEVSRVVDEGKKSLDHIRSEISKFVEEGKDTVKKTVKEEMTALENELAAKKKKPSSPKA